MRRPQAIVEAKELIDSVTDHTGCPARSRGWEDTATNRLLVANAHATIALAEQAQEIAVALRKLADR